MNGHRVPTSQVCTKENGGNGKGAKGDDAEKQAAEKQEPRKKHEQKLRATKEVVLLHHMAMEQNVIAMLLVV